MVQLAFQKGKTTEKRIKKNTNRNGIQIYRVDRQTAGTNANVVGCREGARAGQQDRRDHLFKINYKFHLNRHLTSLPPFARIYTYRIDERAESIRFMFGCLFLVYSIAIALSVAPQKTIHLTILS